jgi:hypothetical protein
MYAAISHVLLLCLLFSDSPRPDQFPFCPNLRTADGGSVPMWACLTNSSRWAGLGDLPRRSLYQSGDWPTRIGLFLKNSAFTQDDGPNSLGLMDRALAVNLMPSVSVVSLPRYRCAEITHAVNVVYADSHERPDAQVCIVDPNFPGQLEWLSRPYFETHCFGGWVAVMGHLKGH